MAQQTDAVSDRAEQTAEYITDVVSGWDVTIQHHRSENVRFAVYRNDEVSVNGYAKGAVINKVLQEVPALVVDSTEDGKMAVTFKFYNE